MLKAVVTVLLCAAGLASVESFVCNDRVKPGQVQNIRQTNTGFYNGYSSIDFAWERPNDPSPTGSRSCIKAYEVELYRLDGQRIQSANIPVTLDSTGGTYQARGLTPGNQYRLSVVAVGPGTGNGAPSGQRGPFTAAPANICDDSKRPGQVSSSNIRLSATSIDNSFSTIKWEFDRPNDKDGGIVSCINAYEVAIFNYEGRQFVSANVPVEAAHTKGFYEARGLTPGGKYYISVRAKSPKQGDGAPPAGRTGPFTAAGGGSVGPRTADEKGK